MCTNSIPQPHFLVPPGGDGGVPALDGGRRFQSITPRRSCDHKRLNAAPSGPFRAAPPAPVAVTTQSAVAPSAPAAGPSSPASCLVLAARLRRLPGSGARVVQQSAESFLQPAGARRRRRPSGRLPFQVSPPPTCRSAQSPPTSPPFQLKFRAIFVCWRSWKRVRRAKATARSAGAWRTTPT